MNNVAERLQEIEALLEECQRHNMSGIQISCAQLRALKDATNDYKSGWIVGYRQGRHLALTEVKKIIDVRKSNEL